MMVQVNIEKHEDGTYWGVTQNVPGVVSAYGNTLEELKSNLEIAYADYIDTAKELGEEWVRDVEKREGFEYRLDLTALFKLIPEIKITSLAKKAKINESLMRQYVSGKASVSEERLKVIENIVHQLGNELLAVRF
jgi:predicted RNase H-like HicB family nuclease